jgi:hypothetical protein
MSLVADVPGVAQDKEKPRQIGNSVFRSPQFWRSRPARKDGPLRVENISDEEVREIQGVMSEQFPGAIVNIGGVTVGCPCQDGVSCDSQVWVVAHQVGRTHGLMMSRIDDQWVIGPLQQWWRQYDALSAQISAVLKSDDPARFEIVRDLQEQRLRHQQDFPACDATPGLPTQTARQQ